MFRILLIVAVLLVGYDAIIHHGAYTRSIWDNLVGLTGSAVDGARGLGERARE